MKLIHDPEKLTKQQLLDSIEPLLASMKNQIDLLFNEDDHLIKKTTPTYNELFNRSQLIHEHLENRRLHELNSEDQLYLDDFRSTLASIDKLVGDYVNEGNPYVKRDFEQKIHRLYRNLQNILTPLKSYINKVPIEKSNAKSEQEDEIKKGPTLQEFFSQYLDHVKASKAPKTFETYSYSLELFRTHIGDKRLNHLSARDLETFKEKRKKTVSDTTINMDIRAIKAAMTAAVDWGLLENNPFHKVKKIKTPKRQPIYLRKKEFEKLCEKIPNQKILDIVKFAVNTGLRPGELCNLKWEDIEFNRHIMRIQSSTVYRVKHGMMRIVPLNDAALNILRKQERNSDFVFPNRKGDLLNSDYVSRKFKKAVRDAGLSEEIKFRHTRSTFACWAVSSGVSVYAVKQILGHSTVSTTEIYAQFDDNKLMDEITKIKPIGESEIIDEKTLEDVLANEDA